MTNLRPLRYSWQVSRYDPELRELETRWESWTDRSDIGGTFNGLVVYPEEYQRVEESYVTAAVQFAVDASARLFRVVYVGHQGTGFALEPDQVVGRSDLGLIVRANLRGHLDCAVESTNGAYQLAFGYDLYMYVAAETPCERAVDECLRAGLSLRAGIPLALWRADEDELTSST